MQIWTTLAAVGLIVAWAAPALAQVSASTSAETLAGSVKDVSGIVLQAVTVRVFAEPAGEDEKPVREAVTDERGRFSIALPSGLYRVEVTAPAFTRFDRTVTIGPDTTPLEITLDLQPIDVVVDVAPDTTLVANTTVSLTSITLSGDDLLDLPRSEEDLATYLLTLAGADPSDDLDQDILQHVVMDGFENGRLPSPEQIAQIIIDPSSLDGRGRPRIQIVTRPGTGRWRWSVDTSFASSALNARTPGELRKEPRQTLDVQARIEAPVIPNRLEMTLQMSAARDERAGSSLRAITPAEELFEGVVQPQHSRNVQVGARLQINQARRLDVQARLESQRAPSRGVGGFRLHERGSDRTREGWSVQIAERVTGTKAINNLRLQITRRTTGDEPVHDGYAINVADAFMGGGGTTDSANDDMRVRVDEELRLTRGPWTLQVGGQGQYQSRVSIDRNNYNGTYEFASLHDYCFAIGFDGVNCEATRQLVAAAQQHGAEPYYADALGEQHPVTGTPVTFRQSLGNANFTFTQTSFGGRVQADRTLGPRASVGFGVRYEATNHSRDMLRLDPTATVQYQLRRGTVVSGGAQLSFQDFSDHEQLLRNDGSTYQSELSISYPSFPDPFRDGEAAFSDRTRSRWVLDPEYRSPYTLSPQVSATHEAPGGLRLTLSYEAGFGWHQRRTRNSNAPFPGTPLADELLAQPRAARQAVIDQMRPMYPHLGNVTRIESSGRSQSRHVRLRVQPRRGLSVVGLNISGNATYSYRLGWDDNDVNNPWEPEWAISRRDHELQSQFRIGLPTRARTARPLLRALAKATYEGVNLNVTVRANTGRLYSLSSGRDLNGDQSSRDRPVGIARNTEVGPGTWHLDTTFTKEVRLWTTGGSRDSGGANPGRPSARNSREAGSGPTFRLQARVNNLLNRSQPRAYGNVVTSPLFGLPTGYTGGRTISLSMRVGL